MRTACCVHVDAVRSPLPGNNQAEMEMDCQARTHPAGFRYGPRWETAGESTRRDCTFAWSVHFRPVQKTENPPYDLSVNIFFRHKIIRPKQNSSKKYNLEILSFVNGNKNRTEYLSFKKLQYDSRTEIGPKIAFNTIYEKPWLLRFLAITFLMEASLPLGLRTGNMVQKWAKFLCYIFYSFSLITHKLQKVRLHFFRHQNSDDS